MWHTLQAIATVRVQTLWDPIQTSFLTLQGILRGARTLQGPILTHFPDPTNQIKP